MIAKKVLACCKREWDFLRQDSITASLRTP